MKILALLLFVYGPLKNRFNVRTLMPLRPECDISGNNILFSSKE
jgi:hypothetical protein